LQDTPLQTRILDKKELRKLASSGCPNLSFEFEATTDREEEEGSGPELSNLWQQTSSLARSLAPTVACLELRLREKIRVTDHGYR
jgi:hypothetical protein